MANLNQMDPEYHVIFYLRHGCDIKYRDIYQLVLFFQTMLLFCFDADYLAFVTCKCVRLDSSCIWTKLAFFIHYNIQYIQYTNILFCN